MKFQKRTILNNNNEKLVGYLYKNTSKSLIIVCHGVESNNNPDDQLLRKTIPEYFAELSSRTGASVFSFDFSGFGESEGKLTYSLRKRDQEIKSVIDYFASDYNEIILYGFSFAGISVAIAAKKYRKIARLVTVNGFFSYNPRYSYLPLILLTCYYLLKYPSFVRDFYFMAKNMRVKNIEVPVLVVMSERDNFVNPKQSHNFYNKLQTRKKLVTFKSNDHAMRDGNFPLAHEVAKWLKEVTY
ncbi:MAG TPA: prolyl oligopeptidase family serine peptidase [Candidatus Acidoferrales bacterium]|nr:prolyl oligopeptidase family serine peptidase [Candidatus Acidoferrales bacterium]